jgi:hypothetical protein
MANLNEEEPKKGKKLRLNNKIPTQYGKYSGIVDESGKTISKPTSLQAMKNMVQYLKHNTPESNVYRPEHAHTSAVYDKKKGTPNA